jgi:hypothetical protein
MKESEQLLAQGLPVLNECLKAKGQHSIEAVPASPARRRLVLTVKPQLEDPTGSHLLGQSEISDRLCEPTVR